MTKETRSRGHNGYIPTPDEVREYRGDKTQSEAAELIYTSARVWRSYELGEKRMHPAAWELLKYKLKERS